MKKKTWEGIDYDSPAGEAADIVSGRERGYAPPIVEFTGTAMIWSAIIMLKHGIMIDFDAEDVALFMTALKLAREAGSPKHDNRVDACGYPETLAQIVAVRKAIEIGKISFEDIVAEWGSQKRDID